MEKPNKKIINTVLLIITPLPIALLFGTYIVYKNYKEKNRSKNEDNK